MEPNIAMMTDTSSLGVSQANIHAMEQVTVPSYRIVDQDWNLRDVDRISRVFTAMFKQAGQDTTLIGYVAEELSPSEREFREQRQAYFLKNEREPLFLEPYRGQYVVSHNGAVLDHDFDLPTLTNRFFSQHEDMPIYIARVDSPIRFIIDTPFLD
jgi:hypothetical protein